MSEVYVPGVKSRFDTEKIVEGLMAVERLPRERIQTTVDTLQSQKTYWQDLGRRMSDMRENARSLFSFQNPFNERSALSSDDSVLRATTSREADAGEYEFVVRQTAAADRFISKPVASDFRVDAGRYSFSVGETTVSFDYRGGTLRDFANTLTQRGAGTVSARLVNVRKDAQALVVESQVTGEENPLRFEDAAEKLAVETGIIEVSAGKPEPVKEQKRDTQPERTPDADIAPERRTVNIRPVDIEAQENATGEVLEAEVPTLRVTAEGSARVGLDGVFNSAEGFLPDAESVLRFQIALKPVESALAAPAESVPAADGPQPDEPDALADNTAEPDTAPEAAAQEASPAASTAEKPADLNVVSLLFADGTSVLLPLASADAGQDAPAADAAQDADAAPAADAGVDAPQEADAAAGAEDAAPDAAAADSAEETDSEDGFQTHELNLASLAAGKAISAITVTNVNTGHEALIRNIQITLPAPPPEPVQAAAPEPAPPPRSPKTVQTPLNAISQAQDAIVLMDGIEIRRPANAIDDLVPGLTLNARAASDKPVRLNVESDTESIKDSVISLMGTYNRLMAELNVLTRKDESILQDLGYLSSDEQESMKKRLGVFSGDSTLLQLRSSLLQAMTAPYRTADGDPVMLSQFGIGADVRRSGAGGYDASRMRGYMEIDEQKLDAALTGDLNRLKELFGLDTDGDLVIDAGLAYNLDRLTQSWVQTGGTIALKTSSIDSRVQGDQRRLETIDRQLEQKEATLKAQYAQMESAYAEMERMTNSLQQFGNNGNE